MEKKNSNQTSDSENTNEAENETTNELRPTEPEEPNSKECSEDDKFKGRIDIHTLNYFKRVEKFLEEDSFDDAESRELFVNNVLSQIGEGAQTCQLAKHRLTSKILETLLGMCTASQVAGIFKSLLSDVLKISNDRFGSHVLQKVISLIPKHSDKEKTEANVVSELDDLVSDFAKIMKKTVDELIRSLYCCHILSCFIQMLGGMSISENVSRSRNSRMTRKKFFGKKTSRKTGAPSFGNIINGKATPMSEHFQKILHKLAKKIIADDNFGELLCHRNASGVIQTLLLTLKENDPNMCSKMCNLIIEKSRLLEWSGGGSDGNGPGRVPILFADEVGSHAMEKIFYVMPVDLFEKLFAKCLTDNLLAMSLHPLANYILQHALTMLPNEKLALQALQELIPLVEDILASGNMGVVVRIAEVCLKFSCFQKEFTQALIKSVHVPDTKHGKNAFFKLLLTLSTYDVIFATEKKESGDEEKNGDTDAQEKKIIPADAGKLTKETINYHGACLVKTVLQFSNASRLIKCILNMDDELLLLMKHEYGSFVLEAFIASPSISKLQRFEFISKIKDDIISVATDKFGSHVIDKLWSQSGEPSRKIIEEELTRHKSLLRGNMYGRIVMRNCGLEFQPQAVMEKTERVVETTSVNKKETDSKQKEKKTQNLVDTKAEREPSKKRKKENAPPMVSYTKELETLAVGMKENSFYSKMDDGTDGLGPQVTVTKKDEIDELFDKCFAKKRTKKERK